MAYKKYKQIQVVKINGAHTRNILSTSVTMLSHVILQKRIPLQRIPVKGRQSPLKAAYKLTQGDILDNAFHGFQLLPGRMLK